MTTTDTTTAAGIATEEIMGAVPTDRLIKLLLDTSHQRGKVWARCSSHEYWVNSDVIVHRPAAAGRTEIQWWLIQPATGATRGAKPRRASRSARPRHARPPAAWPTPSPSRRPHDPTTRMDS